MQHIATSSIIKVERNTGIQPKQRLLSLYNEPPSMELTLDEFEMTSLDRLQLLRAMDVLKAKGFEEAEFNRKLSEVIFGHFPLQSPSNSLFHNHCHSLRKDSYVIRRMDITAWMISKGTKCLTLFFVWLIAAQKTWEDGLCSFDALPAHSRN